MMAATYHVEGMTCGGCAKSVTQAILQSLPTAQVFVDLDQKAVRVEGAHDAQAVQDAVEGAGFDFGGPVQPA
jgi:copper chaperone